MAAVALVARKTPESLIEMFSNGRDKFFISNKQVAWLASIAKTSSFSKGRVNRFGPWEFVAQYNGAGEVRRVCNPEYYTAFQSAHTAAKRLQENACDSMDASKAFQAAARESNRVADLYWMGNAENRAIADYFYNV